MSFYPTSLDDDTSLIRIDDNLSELGGQAINQLREAVFAIEGELGLTPSGSAGSVANRLNVSLNADGTIKSSALSSVGLVTLPIDNAQVGTNAGIEESKLSLNYSTSSLHTRISAAEALLSSLSTFVSAINSNLRIHVAGGEEFLDGTLARHVASHIDLNAVPSDSRDISYTWSGLQDKDGNDRSASTVAEALDEINTDLITHENTTAEAHPATAITVDTSNFFEISSDADNVQKALDDLDDSETLRMGLHRATMHDNGVNRTARSSVINIDGYGQNIVPATLARAFHIESPATGPVDNNVTGDDLIAFQPTNTNFVFDSQFAQIRPGDIIRINYGTGFEGIFTIDEIRHIPDQEWVVRINNINLCSTDGYTCFARVDRPLFTDNTAGVFACASANNDIDGNIQSSIIIGNPRGAMALGNGFEPSQLDGYHYNLYLNLYPTGDPSEKTINLPAIDVTGNQGQTPGAYTLEGIVQTTNNAFRTAGYNYRFIAFSHKGNFGIMLADYVDNASFSIVNGSVSGSTLIEGSFTNNVIGDATDGRDGLGLGGANAAIASPNYTSTFSNEGAASNLFTRVIVPLKSRNAIINGVRRDDFPETYGIVGDGYWAAEITNRVVISTTTVEVTYTIDRDLSAAPLLAGKTIVVAPMIDVNDGAYLVQDYGRFVIKSVTFTDPCGEVGAQTIITVVNGVHGTGDPDDTTSAIGLDVRLYFSDDSVAFNQGHVVDAIISSADFLRVHEIYLDEEGHSFSHERARMPKQSGTASLLNTNSGWSFRRISPKLTGYRDDEASVDFRRYLRLYILSYDSVTGEFDGYVGRRVVGVDSITNFGRVVRSRKNQPVRFYDHTNLDYIEVQFTELNSSTTSITTPRYVDIEIFPSIATNDEYFMLASTELDGNSIVNIIDEREFGGVSEKNFSTSAIQFIEAGDRLLHGNGVFYGLDYAGEDSSDSVSGLLFNGGSVLVNGRVVTVNNTKVNIPLVDVNTSSVNYAVCVDINGNFVPVIFSPDINHSREEVFVSNESGSNTYFIRSSTFEELTSTESELVIVAVVNVNAFNVPITINSVKDVRKFVLNETAHISLVWAENDDGITNREGFAAKGHFTSFEQVKNWINYSEHRNFVIKLKGEFYLTSSVDLTGITTIVGTGEFKRIIFDGSEGSTIYVANDLGFKVTAYVTLKDIMFRYQPNNPVSSGFLHANVNTGCIYSDSDINGLNIVDCTFKSEILSGQRPPFINLKLSGTPTNIRINNNKFYDQSNDSGRNAAVVLSPLSTGNQFLQDTEISHNYCNYQQKIAIISNFTRGETTSGGIMCRNVVISNNFFDSSGAIGYMIRSWDLEDSLIIENNTCHAIMFMDEEGNWIVNGGTYTPDQADFSNGTGKVIIRNNTCATISTVNIGHSSSDSLTALTVSGNNVACASTNDLTARLGFAAGFVSGIQIYQDITAAIDNTFTALITNNNIKGNGVLTNGILCNNSNCIISGNVIHGFTTNGISVFQNYAASGGDFDGYAVVKDNIIFRNGTSISAYISFFARGIVSHNVLDSTTINGSSTATISFVSSELVSVYGNINNVRTNKIDIIPGMFDGLVENVVATNISAVSFAYNATQNVHALWISIPSAGSSFNMSATIPIGKLIPLGARLLSVFTFVFVNTPGDWSSGSVVMNIYERNTSAALNTSNTYSTTGSISANIGITGINLPSYGDYNLVLSATSLNTATTDTLYFTTIDVTYAY